jgi:hypothetical protein
MATCENPTPILDPEEFQKESKRVMNKLRSDLDNLNAAEETGTPLLRYDATGRKVMAGAGKDYRGYVLPADVRYKRSETNQMDA